MKIKRWKIFISWVEGRTLGGAGMWDAKYPCYRIDFLFNPEGRLRYLGDSRDFHPEWLKRYSQGSFRVAVNTPAISDLVRRGGLIEPSFRQERIVTVGYTRETAQLIRDRLLNTAAEYNLRFGFEETGTQLIEP